MKIHVLYLPNPWMKMNSADDRRPRALLGGPLHGDKLVRIVYLDDAGNSDVDGRFLIVSALIVHGDHQLDKIKSKLRDIQQQFVPEDLRDSLVLHTCDIYGGNKEWDKRRYPDRDSKRVPLMHALAKLLANVNVVIAMSMTDKQEFTREKFGVTNDKDYLRNLIGLGYLSCMLEVDLWFKQNRRRENCFVVVEDHRDVREAIKVIHRRHQDPKYAELLPESDREYFPLSRIHEDPNFQEKRVAHPLILADFTAFMVKRLAMSDPFALQFVTPWWKTRLAAGKVRLPALPDPVPVLQEQ